MLSIFLNSLYFSSNIDALDCGEDRSDWDLGISGLITSILTNLRIFTEIKAKETITITRTPKSVQCDKV
jgi:hypothetical protein